MAKFKPGQSGNPNGRPKTAKSLRALLIKKYGEDAGVLVDRLEALSVNRNPKIAQQATEILLNYHAGRPIQAVNLGGDPAEPLHVVIDEDQPASRAG